jgi:hypothetical protein
MSAGTCEKCGTEPGTPHTFLYGKVDVSSVMSGTTTTTTTHSQVKGEASASIGSRCIESLRKGSIRRQTIGLVIFSTLILAGIAFFVVGSSDGIKIAGFLGAAAALFAVCIFIILLVTERKKTAQTYGEELAIALRKPDLKGQGFDGFWSQADWAQTLRAAEMRRR